MPGFWGLSSAWWFRDFTLCSGLSIFELLSEYVMLRTVEWKHATILQTQRLQVPKFVGIRLQIPYTLSVIWDLEPLDPKL